MGRLDYFNGISPYIRRAWDANLSEEWRLKQRVIFDYELVYIMEGECEIKIEDRCYTAKPGEVYFFRPGIPHAMYVPKGKRLRQPHIHFDFFYDEISEKIEISYKSKNKLQEKDMCLFREDINKLDTLMLPDRLELKSCDEFEELLFKIINVCEDSTDELMRMKSKTLMIQILILVFGQILGEEKQNSRNGKVSNNEMANTMREYLRLNYRKDLTLETLSLQFGLSKNHLIRVFSEAFGNTPIQYLISVRIEKAKLLLRERHNTITEIAAIVAFNDIQYFSRTFSKAVGMTPTQYRANNQLK
jgi:AraC-like DNA-binding protein